MSTEERGREATVSLADDAAEIGERALAIITDSAILGHVPIAKWGVSIARCVRSVRDQLLMKKLDVFMRQLSSLPPEKRQEMVRKLQEDRDYSESVGEHLIELLDRINGRRKALMTGGYSRHFADEKISRSTLYRLTHAIEVLNTRDLPTLRNLTEEGPLTLGPMSSGRKFTPDQESLLALATATLVHSFSAFQ